MNSRLRVAAYLAVAALAGFAGYHYNQARLEAETSATAARRLLLAPLTGLDGNKRTLTQTRERILLVNFWATWCLPCRKEIPGLQRIGRKYAGNGLKVVGIAIDNAAKVREYAADMKIDYDLAIAGMDILAISKDLGNSAGALPFTVVLDRDRKLAYAHAGLLTEADLEAMLRPLL